MTLAQCFAAKKAPILFAICIHFLAFNGDSPILAQPAPPFRWAARGGGKADEAGNSIAVDSQGNSYITGYFQSTNAAFGSTVLTNAGGADICIVKYDFTGAVAWARRCGGAADDVGNSVAVDTAGNAYVSGFFQSSSLDFGGRVLTNRGGADIFVAKYDPNGNVLWAKAAGGTGYDAASAIAVGPTGAVFVTGFFYSSNAFFGALALTNSGQSGVFLAKYDTDGNELWVKQAGGNSFDMSFAVAVDPAGEAFIAGNFLSSTIVFGAGITLTNSGQNDVFLAKYDPSGNAAWARQVKGVSDDFAYGVAADNDGNSYLTGTFLSPVATLAPGLTLTNSGHTDIFLAKYDAGGGPLWAEKAGGASDDYSYGMALDSSTNIYVAGNYFSTNASFGGVLLTNAGGHELFVTKYNNSGTVLWARRAGGLGSDFANAVAVDVGGNCHLTGYYALTNCLFDSIALTNAGGKDIFVAQLDGDSPSLGFELAENQLVLFWPTSQLGFTLESTPDLSGLNGWSPVTNSAVAVGEQYFVTNSFPSDMFFRLRR